ncbi:hypothetical protein GGG87_02300 [Streptococcus sp. zg-86]|uniref:Phage protein n=1 Tax=Streptococcus zhangguiae TaxID=2664091 RepID=A0A6I4R7S0_9STRE|nr:MULTISPECIES: hypothetical protein [unclassified Streptococcus]MTB63844.1 hypothetical protein [Streptococcus sp. zg-86]MTB90154.1 hypothetical protein [Streptococcus sp. zg-36]MWV55826.1 hypothetical protein [Streptococcus sp. zg-70]QTH47891.1 hypothetical protein J5M87_00700 [Streptococcus sp. zg-86]
MTIFTIDKTKYTEQEIENMRQRHEDSRNAKIFFSELFGEYKADVITSNVQIQYHNRNKKWANTFEEAWRDLGYRAVADIIFRAINCLPCADKDTGEKEEFLKARVGA